MFYRQNNRSLSFGKKAGSTSYQKYCELRLQSVPTFEGARMEVRVGMDLSIIPVTACQITVDGIVKVLCGIIYLYFEEQRCFKICHKVIQGYGNVIQ